MRLLIVEDEKQICDTVAKSLYGAGYEVDTCYDGEEALECILAENYDLIVLDLNLPGMDGMEILKELRQRNEETKVLILSARSQICLLYTSWDFQPVPKRKQMAVLLCSGGLPKEAKHKKEVMKR